MPVKRKRTPAQTNDNKKSKVSTPASTPVAAAVALPPSGTDTKSLSSAAAAVQADDVLIRIERHLNDISQNLTDAIKLFKDGTEKKPFQTINRLISLLEEPSDSTAVIAANELLMQAGKQDGELEFCEGFCHELGIGKSFDSMQALESYKKSAAKKNPFAICYLLASDEGQKVDQEQREQYQKTRSVYDENLIKRIELLSSLNSKIKKSRITARVTDEKDHKAANPTASATAANLTTAAAATGTAAASASTTVIVKPKPDSLEYLHDMLKDVLAKMNTTNAFDTNGILQWLKTHQTHDFQKPSDHLSQTIFQEIDAINSPAGERERTISQHLLGNGTDGKPSNLFVRDVNKAFYWTAAAAIQGNLTAVNSLAMFYFGTYSPQHRNSKMGFWLLTWAATHNDPTALFNLAFKYQKGITDNQTEILKPNLKWAYHYYHKALGRDYTKEKCHTGMVETLLACADAYLHGRGFAQDNAKAFNYVGLAAQSFPNVSAKLQINIRLTEAHYHYNQIGTSNFIYPNTCCDKQNYALYGVCAGLAFNLLGAAEDQLKTFERYLVGDQIPQNLDLALWWLKRAAMQKLPIAQYYLSNFDVEKPQTIEDAVELWEEFEYSFLAANAVDASSPNSSSMAAAMTANSGNPAFSVPRAASQSQSSTGAAAASVTYSPPRLAS